ncbi:hypothetical protein [Curtobacterium sp. MCBD17_026]|uniref:hypothetical protein n=1 Tax=Curtobacterium sp. MCBD17_026 TaxID=2175621 RepID=UPI000DA9B924|nr:hypothetical protein [Curtobacterium sp. MCBD17_026]WIB69801.1 hypothetical protein DEI85_11570 [Curtobacterium sp. MCBD17_026]
MTAAKPIHVRHIVTGEIKTVTPEQRETQNKNFWVRVTGDVKVTEPDTAPPATDVSAAPKTTQKASTPKE